MRVAPHSHPCQRCGVKTECGGTYEPNEDGFPEVICREFHLDGGINPDFRCETCAELVDCEGNSDDCTLIATTSRETTDGWLPAERFCAHCAADYDRFMANYEPPDVRFDDALGKALERRGRE